LGYIASAGVAVDSDLCGRGPELPIPIEERAVAEGPVHIPSVDLLPDIGRKLVHLRVTVLHAEEDLRLVLKRQVLEVEFLPRLHANAGELGTDALLFRTWGGANCKAKSRYSKKFVFKSALSILGKVMTVAVGGAVA
jgi:hypothetical protein